MHSTIGSPPAKTWFTLWPTRSSTVNLTAPTGSVNPNIVQLTIAPQEGVTKLKKIMACTIPLALASLSATMFPVSATATLALHLFAGLALLFATVRTCLIDNRIHFLTLFLNSNATNNTAGITAQHATGETQ